ncbi:MAG: hypothetical protein JSR47_06240 [Proteobacteria bacterium]|nr:hypothetical protein [Pseudomonadota bacterium]
MSFPPLAFAASFLRWKAWALLAAVSLPLVTTACYPAPGPPPSPIQEAAQYDWLIGEQRYSKPVNAWVRNKRLERFLLQTYETGGLDALKAQYGFDCSLRAIVPPCGDCLVCHASLPMNLGGQPMIIGASHGMASMKMLLEIGPDPEDFRAMTYWERLPSNNRK